MHYFFAVVIFFLATSAHATTYYVTPTGSDTAAGTLAAPWRTIQKAATVMVPGDVVTVSAGVYAERVQVTHSGTAALPITYLAQGAVVTQGFTIKASYNTVSGFESTNSITTFPNGVGMYVEGARNRIENNYVHDTFWEGIWVYGGSKRNAPTTNSNIVAGNVIVRPRVVGVMVEGVNNTIEGNDISHSLQYPPGAPARSGADADGIRFFGSGHTIRGNYIHDIFDTDPGNVDPHIDCFQTWGPATNMTFDGNTCHGQVSNLQAAMIGNSDAVVNTLTFRNNVFFNATRGINMTASAKYKLMGNMTVVHNTFANLSEQGVLLMSAPNSVVQNNFFYDVGSNLDKYLDFKDTKSTGLTVGYNAMWASVGQPFGTPYPHDVWQIDPQVANPLAHDYHLLSSSPLIDVGLTLPSVTTDHDGVIRPTGASSDIGAYEYH